MSMNAAQYEMALKDAKKCIYVIPREAGWAVRLSLRNCPVFMDTPILIASRAEAEMLAHKLRHCLARHVSKIQRKTGGAA